MVVVSSTGDGDAPDNSIHAVQKLKGTKLPRGLFDGVPYTTLGLGDSNYSRFMEVPRVVRKSLEKLGGKHFYPSVEADEVDGIEEIVEKWADGLWAPLKTALQDATNSQKQADGGKSSGSAAAKVAAAGPVMRVKAKVRWLDAAEAGVALKAREAAREAAARDAEGRHAATAPLAAVVRARRYLTTDASHANGRTVVHMEIAPPEGGRLAAQPGDALGLMAANDPALVERLLARLGLSASADRTFACGDSLPYCTPREALARRLEVAGACRKSTVRSLAVFCADGGERAAMAALAADKARFRAEVTDAQLSLLGLLERFTSCTPPLAALLEVVPSLAPRYYSLCNDPGDDGTGACHVAFSVVDGGVATNYLAGRAVGDAVDVFVHPGGNFAHPDDDLKAPLVMIGPGTGVAPFRGFLQRRARLAAARGITAGPAWLFFGCRRRDHDFLYGDELEGGFDGALTQLEVAFSREAEGGEKVYVQHKMAAAGEQLYEALLQGGTKGRVMICGDGAHMAKSVGAELARGLGGDAVLKTMREEGRYILDLWS